MNKIINILKKQKAIPIDQFINVALYNKKFGYYMKKNPFGKHGDYITAPLVSNLFGEIITLWCVAFWEYLKKPKKIYVVELGPGDASLCDKMLKTSKIFENFYNSVEFRLLEKSKVLRKLQKNKIRNKKVKWVSTIQELKEGPIIFLGNEFFDSLPIKQLYKKKDQFYEKYVTFLKKDKKINFLFKKAKKNLIKNIKKWNLDTEKGIIEYPDKAIKYLDIITKKINKYDGCLLAFDYGYNQNKNQNTLQSINKHEHVNIFYDIGSSDITSHVNFKLFTKVLNKRLKVEKIISQSKFLQRMGIIERANILSKEMSFKSKADMYYRLRRLLHNDEMGNLFKVLFAKNKKTKFSLGFD
tara:strand:+ start:5062 stop:6126 length:1065 start_codon:yes stop_codon:yes gene_type:complete